MLGFSFLFRGVDDGLENSLARTKQGFSALGEVASDVGSSMRTAFDVLSLSNIQNQLETLTGGTINLITSLEAEFFELGKTAQPILAGMGLRGNELNKAMSKATGLAHKWQVGSEEVANTMMELEKSTREVTAVLEKMNLTTEELVKFQRATGTSGTELIDVLHSLSNSYGFSTDQAEEFVNSFSDIAQATTGAQQGFRALPKDIQVLDDVLSEIGDTIEDQPAFVARYLKETQKLSKVFRLAAGNMEGARDASSAFTKFLLEGRRDLKKAEQGLGEFGKSFEDLAVSTGHAGGVMDLFSKSPEEALLMLAKMRKGIGNNATMLTNFNTALKAAGPELAFLVPQLDRMDEELKKTNKDIEATTGGLKGLTKAANPATRNLQEVLDLMEQQHEVTIRKLSGGTGEFLKLQKRSYKATQAALKDMTQDPSLGNWVKMLLGADFKGMESFFERIVSFRRDKKTGELIFGKKDVKRLGDMFDLLKKNEKSGFLANLVNRFDLLKKVGPAAIFMDINKALGSKEGFNEQLATASEKLEDLFVKIKTWRQILEPLLPGLGLLAGVMGILLLTLKVLTPIWTMFSAVVGSGVVGTALSAIASAIGAVVTALGGWVVLAIVAVLAIAAFVVALGALFALPQKHKDAFGDWLSGMGISMDNMAEEIMNWDVDAFIDKVVEVIDGAFDAIGEAIKGFGDLANYFIAGIEPPEKNKKLIKGIEKFMIGLGKLIIVSALKIDELYKKAMERMFRALYLWMGKKWIEFKNNLERDLVILRDDLAKFLEDSIMGGFGDLVLHLSNEFDKAVESVVTFGKEIKAALDPRTWITGALKGVARVLERYVLLPIIKFAIAATHVLHEAFHGMFLRPIEQAIVGIGKTLRQLYESNPIFAGALVGVGVTGPWIKELEDFKITFSKEIVDDLMEPIRKKEREIEKKFKDDETLKENTGATAELTGAVLNLTDVLNGRSNGHGGSAATASVLVPQLVTQV